MFKVKENGKVYEVAVRAAFQDRIKSERKLREVVSRSMTKQYGIDKPLFEACSILGILSYKARIDRK